MSCKRDDVNLTYTGVIGDLEVPVTEQLGLHIPLQFLKKVAYVNANENLELKVFYKIFVDE